MINADIPSLEKSQHTNFAQTNGGLTGFDSTWGSWDDLDGATEEYSVDP